MVARSRPGHGSSPHLPGGHRPNGTGVGPAVFREEQRKTPRAQGLGCLGGHVTEGGGDPATSPSARMRRPSGSGPVRWRVHVTSLAPFSEGWTAFPGAQDQSYLGRLPRPAPAEAWTVPPADRQAHKPAQQHRICRGCCNWGREWGAGGGGRRICAKCHDIPGPAPGGHGMRVINIRT